MSTMALIAVVVLLAWSAVLLGIVVYQTLKDR